MLSIDFVSVLYFSNVEPWICRPLQLERLASDFEDRSSSDLRSDHVDRWSLIFNSCGVRSYGVGPTSGFLPGGGNFFSFVAFPLVCALPLESAAQNAWSKDLAGAFHPATSALLELAGSGILWALGLAPFAMAAV
jgi:hypothetical protein